MWEVQCQFTIVSESQNTDSIHKMWNQHIASTAAYKISSGFLILVIQSIRKQGRTLLSFVHLISILLGLGNIGSHRKELTYETQHHWGRYTHTFTKNTLMQKQCVMSTVIFLVPTELTSTNFLRWNLPNYIFQLFETRTKKVNIVFQTSSKLMLRRGILCLMSKDLYAIWCFKPFIFIITIV